MPPTLHFIFAIVVHYCPFRNVIIVPWCDDLFRSIVQSVWEMLNRSLSKSLSRPFCLFSPASEVKVVHLCCSSGPRYPAILVLGAQILFEHIVVSFFSPDVSTVSPLMMDVSVRVLRHPRCCLTFILLHSLFLTTRKSSWYIMNLLMDIVHKQVY